MFTSPSVRLIKSSWEKKSVQGIAVRLVLDIEALQKRSVRSKANTARTRWRRTLSDMQSWKLDNSTARCGGKRSRRSGIDESWSTHPLALANKFCVDDGLIVPVDEAEDAEEESSSCESAGKLPTSSNSSSCASSMLCGTSGGSLASIDFAKDL